MLHFESVAVVLKYWLYSSVKIMIVFVLSLYVNNRLRPLWSFIRSSFIFACFITGDRPKAHTWGCLSVPHRWRTISLRSYSTSLIMWRHWRCHFELIMCTKQGSLCVYACVCVFTVVYFYFDSVSEQLIILEMNCHSCLMHQRSSELQIKEATLTIIIFLRVRVAHGFIIKTADLHSASNKMFKTNPVNSLTVNFLSVPHYTERGVVAKIANWFFSH